jgi:tetratricopeptide (TPR) repeat protein
MRYFLIPVVVIILMAPAFCRTAAFEDGEARAAIQRVVELTFLLEYEQGLETADRLEAMLPSHPVVPLLRAGVLYCRMLDHEDLLDLEAFDAAYQQAWARSEEMKKAGEAAEANLYFGVLLGFKALLQQRRGAWWPAVKYGMKSVGYLKDCVEQDSSYKDAYLGIGTYKYWRSRATDFINWLPFIPDQKKEGIALIRRAMEEGLFGREISRSTLAWILIDNGRPSEAVLLSIEGLKLYPGSRFYLWTLADGYLHTGRWKAAAEIYQQLYDSIHLLRRNNHYNELGICKQMARCYQNMQKPEIALEWVERGLALQLSEDVRERRKNDLERLAELKISLQKKISGNP